MLLSISDKVPEQGKAVRRGSLFVFEGACIVCYDHAKCVVLPFLPSNIILLPLESVPLYLNVELSMHYPITPLFQYSGNSCLWCAAVILFAKESLAGMSLKSQHFSFLGRDDI